MGNSQRALALFNFTVYGLRKLFTEAIFEIESIHPREGSLSYLDYRLHTIPRKIHRLYRRHARLWEKRAFTPEIPDWRYRIARLATQPFFLLLDILASLLILADWWDCEKRFTLGYACVVRKPLPRV